jgi:retinol dehydrogenase-13
VCLRLKAISSTYTSTLFLYTGTIAGANDGIGKETAIDLAKRRATVIIACRQSEKTKQALADIRRISNNNNVFHEAIDLADLDSVKTFATRYIESGRPIHVLINNAGIMALPKRRESKQGFELQVRNTFARRCDLSDDIAHRP